MFLVYVIWEIFLLYMQKFHIIFTKLQISNHGNNKCTHQNLWEIKVMYEQYIIYIERSRNYRTVYLQNKVSQHSHILILMTKICNFLLIKFYHKMSIINIFICGHPQVFPNKTFRHTVMSSWSYKISLPAEQ